MRGIVWKSKNVVHTCLNYELFLAAGPSPSLGFSLGRAFSIFGIFILIFRFFSRYGFLDPAAAPGPPILRAAGLLTASLAVWFGEAPTPSGLGGDVPWSWAGLGYRTRAGALAINDHDLAILVVGELAGVAAVIVLGALVNSVEDLPLGLVGDDFGKLLPIAVGEVSRTDVDDFYGGVIG